MTAATNKLAPEPLVSVMMPFYNGGAGFSAAISSILGQTYWNWELLLCDDGSTDGSLRRAESFGDPRLRIWSDGKRKGLAARLNECIDRSSGTLIARMDADDVSYPERFARQVEFLAGRPDIDLVGCRMLIFSDEGVALGKRSAPLEHEGIVANPAIGFGLAHPTWMARAEWYRQHRYDPAAIRYEDAELLYRAYPTSRFANLPDLLYGYREGSGGLRKRLKTRVGRVRYLATRAHRIGIPELALAAATEAGKALADSLIAATGLRYSLLKVREERLSAEDMVAWQRVSAGSALS